MVSIAIVVAIAIIEMTNFNKSIKRSTAFQ
jgi:hypothetical protein